MRPVACALLTLAAYPYSATAYLQPTHEELTGQAVRKSALSQKVVNLGLSPNLGDKFPNHEGTQLSIVELFRYGAQYEDLDKKALHHFFDPVRDRGLLLYTHSQAWATEEPAQVSEQRSSVRDAIEYLDLAIANADDGVRRAAFGLLFQSLGQVVHHLQDMAQPQHVRHDDHCDDPVKCPTWTILYKPSKYEAYTTPVVVLSVTAAAAENPRLEAFPSRPHLCARHWASISK